MSQVCYFTNVSEIYFPLVDLEIRSVLINYMAFKKIFFKVKDPISKLLIVLSLKNDTNMEIVLSSKILGCLLCMLPEEHIPSACTVN